MPRTYTSLTLEDAKQMLSAAEAKAASLGIPYCVAVVDAGGHLLAFLRQDGALIVSVDLAIDKAATARIFDKTTSDLATLAQPGKPLFGIQESNAGKVVIFGGGVPSFWTEPSSVRSEQVPAPLNKTLRLQRRLSLHLVTRHSRPMHLVRFGRLPSETIGRSSGYPQSTASRNLLTRRWSSSPKADLRQPPSET